MHFDFHAGPDCREIGKNVIEDSIIELLKSVKPDFIQVDCKGHPGLSSYPTKVGNPAPGFIGDPLKIWRSATDKMGVSLYMHYSGVFDQAALKNNPGYGRINQDGKRDTNNTSVFSPYVDKATEAEIAGMCGNVRGVRWHPDFTDLIPADGDKAVGMQVVLEHFGWSRDNAIAFGDGGNDVDMLRFAGIGVAMGNATDEPKTVADYVTDSVDDAGISNALHHFEIL